MSQDNNTNTQDNEAQEEHTITHQTSNLPQDNGNEDDGQGVDYDQKIAELQRTVEALQAEKDKVLNESIERRHKLKEQKSATATLEERLAELERQNRETTLKSARLEAVNKYSLPNEAADLLGDDPDSVAAKAEALSKLLSPKKEEPKQKNNSSQSNQYRSPSGGRNPNARPDADIDALIKQYL